MEIQSITLTEESEQDEYVEDAITIKTKSTQQTLSMVKLKSTMITPVEKVLSKLKTAMIPFKKDYQKPLYTQRGLYQFELQPQTTIRFYDQLTLLQLHLNLFKSCGFVRDGNNENQYLFYIKVTGLIERSKMDKLNRKLIKSMACNGEHINVRKVPIPTEMEGSIQSLICDRAFRKSSNIYIQYFDSQDCKTTTHPIAEKWDSLAIKYDIQK